jgi:hypothetical protein
MTSIAESIKRGLKEAIAFSNGSPPIAVSTWSLHNLLGVTYANAPA